VALIFLDGDYLTCLQIRCPIDGAEATTASHRFNFVASSQNRSPCQQLPLQCPAFGTHIGSQIIFNTAFWVWAKLFLSRRRHRLPPVWLALPSLSQMEAGDFLTASGKFCHHPPMCSFKNFLSVLRTSVGKSSPSQTCNTPKTKMVGGGGIEPRSG